MALVTLRENAESIVGNLSDETKLPRNLLQRFSEMWCNRDPPFFAKVSEDGTLAAGELCELVRSLKVSSALLCSSVTRVISGGAEAVDFETFVRGYARLHARTLKEALPFAFAVFDLDGDGILSQEEFTRVIEANLAMQELDPAAIKRVLNSPKGKDAAGVSYDAFRYFASLTSETILATCGFCLHVRDFYVPLTPLGTEEEEAAEDAAKAEALRVDRERAHAPGGIAASASGEGEGGAAAGEAAAEGDAAYFSDPDFMAAIESLRTTPEERASRCKDKGNEGMKHGKEGIEHAVQSYGEGLDEKCNDAVLNATLYSNRAAAHTMLKNWGKALADASSAVEMDVLPAPSALKACRRGAAAALKLSKLRQAEALCARGEAIEGGAATELKELAAIRKGVAKAREAEEARRRKAAEEAQRETALKAAIAKRGLYIGDFIDPALREQCVGAASGARIWYVP